jgi:hypothetical protein
MAKKKTTMTDQVLTKLANGSRVRVTRQTQQIIYNLRNREYDIVTERTPRGNFYSMGH